MQLNAKVGLGTVQFGVDYGVSNTNGKTAPAEVTKILDYAKEMGIVYLDTASGYGDAEIVLGQNDIDSFKIVSKFLPEGGLESQLKDSLVNLNVSSLYGYLAHRPLELLENKKDWEDLQRLKHGGLVKKVGFSLNTPRELELLLNAGMVPDLVQVPYNYFDNRFKAQLQQLKSRRCEVHTRSAFLQGLFFTDVAALPAFFDEAKPFILKLQQQFEGNLSGALLRYVLSQDFIDAVIMGVEDKNQLEMNLHNIEIAGLPEDEAFQISENILMPVNWPKINQ